MYLEKTFQKCLERINIALTAMNLEKPKKNELFDCIQQQLIGLKGLELPPYELEKATNAIITNLEKYEKI